MSGVDTPNIYSKSRCTPRPSVVFGTKQAQCDVQRFEKLSRDLQNGGDCTVREITLSENDIKDKIFTSLSPSPPTPRHQNITVPSDPSPAWSAGAA